jgi:hypothetical protein
VNLDRLRALAGPDSIGAGIGASDLDPGIDQLRRTLDPRYARDRRMVDEIRAGDRDPGTGLKRTTIERQNRRVGSGRWFCGGCGWGLPDSRDCPQCRCPGPHHFGEEPDASYLPGR